MRWTGRSLEMLDQRVLPGQELWTEMRTWREVGEAISNMSVRGAPAIGIAAAYGMALAAQANEDLQAVGQALIRTRPTAVNLQWAVERIWGLETSEPSLVLAEAKRVEEEDVAMNFQIGEHGAALIPKEAGVLTICNTGGLATGGYGTALGVIRRSHEQGKGIHVYACETRPRQQGLRLTAWELLQDEIPFHAIADGAAAALMASGKVQCAIAGADRIAANGDTANKIGTFGLAVLCRHFGIPFYIAAPSSTLDPVMASGREIPIEERSSQELTHYDALAIAPTGCPVWNPAFDVTPGELIHAIITEQGVHRPPFAFQNQPSSFASLP